MNEYINHIFLLYVVLLSHIFIKENDQQWTHFSQH
jgi:hypothetical protein